ncbi:hypothetical protein OAF85_00115 [Planctomycetota bacterium]|nr:hypothetical protein [Planctomycetota bacterium]
MDDESATELLIGFDCPTEGASISFRFDDAKGWTPFGGEPVEIPAGAIRVHAVAHRIGFKPRS